MRSAVIGGTGLIGSRVVATLPAPGQAGCHAGEAALTSAVGVL
ncbi:hypothetical protein [Microbacterium sp. NPDC058389]